MPKEVTVRARNRSQLIGALKRFRKLAGLTQEDLGQSTGLRQTTISKIETELVDPSLTTLFKLLAALELEIIVQPRQKQTNQWLAQAAE